MRTVDMNEKEDMSDQLPPPSASKLLQQHTQSNKPTTTVGEKVSSNIPFRGFADNGYKKVAPQDMTQLHNPSQPGPVAIFFKGWFSPRATDIQQLLIKLQTQVSVLCECTMLISYVHNIYLILQFYILYIFCSYLCFLQL